MKRRWFQMNLSTAILLMIAAGGLLWSNVHLSHFDIQEYGWPMTMHATSQSTPHDPETYLDSESMDSTMHLDTSGLLKDPSWFSIPVNVMTAMAILVCCALCEWLFRPREGRMP
jgi:hypothetical protein